MTDETTMRRQPKQARGQQRVDLLLHAAAAAFAEVGYENATTNDIARRAGVSIGSLYQFFPNKEAMLTALTERYRTEMRAIFEQYFTPENTRGMTFSDIISGLIEGLVSFKLTHRGFDTIFTSSAVEDTVAVTDMHGMMVQRIEDMLSAHFPALAPERRRLGAEVGIQIVKGLMTLTEPPHNFPVEHVIPEMKRAIIGYVRALLASEGHVLPEDLA
jgi:AcrR family transcriptional regulator